MTTLEPSKTRIILVRHGESLANSGGVTDGHETNPLTALGQSQAKTFAEAISCTPTRIIVSPFLRAQQTARPLIERFPGVPVEEWPIQELTFLEPSRFRNTTEADREPYSEAYWDPNQTDYLDGPGAESFSQFLDRARSALQRLSQLPAGECVVVFTHGYFIQAIRLLQLFPDVGDIKLMANFRQFHFVHPVRNLESLEFELDHHTLRMIDQQHLNAFTLQGETSHA